jgi:transposase
LLAMAEPDEEKRAFRLGWSAWRRAHQAVAKRCEKASRAAKRALFRRESTLEDRTGPHVTTLSPEGAPLTDAEWKMVEPLIPQRPSAGRRYNEHRTVLGGILWVARTGSSWREMPEEEFGKWQTAYRRYELWVKQGLWKRILQALGEEGLLGPTTKGS